jgi:ketosteroid isomerase-like protein
VVSIRDELASFNKEFAVTLAGNDVDRLADFYTEDAVFLSQGTLAVVGRMRILEMFRGPSRAPIRSPSRLVM